VRQVAALVVGFIITARATTAATPARETIDVRAYAAALDEIADVLTAGRIEEAAASSAALEERDVAFGEERLRPDESLLDDVRTATPARATRVARRLHGAAERLRATPAQRAAPADPALVERLKAENKIAPGGEITPPAMRPLTLPERLTQAFEDAIDWLAERLARLWMWLRKFWPETPRGEAASGGGALTLTLIIVAAAVLVLGLLALWTVRRRPRTGTTAVTTKAATRDADEDPLSREASEWERYARELDAAGRRREAIRAWYHAVLSTLFRTGLLEPRKGRTNWEHVARLSPELRWRGQFMDITRRFEREWYGRDESSSDDLGRCAQLAGAILGALRGGEAA
jgi:hypothetical protein